MNHIKIYKQLIMNRICNPVKSTYKERHHIVPKSEGGSDDADNVVNLTAREHYIAHLLLAKIYGDKKMHSAVIYMQTGKRKKSKFKFNSHLYESMREAFGKKHSEYFKKHYIKEKHWNYGKHWSEEDKEKQRIAHKGQKAWNKGIPMSKEAKKKLSINNGAKRQEVRKKISKARLGKLWWNNDIICKQSKDCPGPEWKKGRLKKKKQ